jgi:hypothetical protein
VQNQDYSKSANNVYVNAKMISVKSVPGIGGGEKESSEEMNSSIIYLVHCKNLCKCHNVPPPRTTIK